eukprot:scaffold421279_cov34-Prasinocladus_malaysianus.AAC.2
MPARLENRSRVWETAPAPSNGYVRVRRVACGRVFAWVGRGGIQPLSSLLCRAGDMFGGLVGVRRRLKIAQQLSEDACLVKARTGANRNCEGSDGHVATCSKGISRCKANVDILTQYMYSLTQIRCCAYTARTNFSLTDSD